MLHHRKLGQDTLIKSSDSLLNARLWFFGAAWVHLLIAAVVILPSDISVDPDPKVRVYERLKWRFITAWFNFINLMYFPLCLYCDWKEKKGEGNLIYVSRLRYLRDVIFTSILFPIIMYADTIFWRLYWMDPTLISPLRLFGYMPPWGQHSLHTVSLVVVMVDLLVTPRRRPLCLTRRLLLMTIFFTVYCTVLLLSYLQGEMIYQLLGIFSIEKTVAFTMLSFLECLFYFFLQWIYISCIWGGVSNKSNE